MAIGRTLEESLHKAVRSLEIGLHSLDLPEARELSEEELERRLVKADDERLFLVMEALRRGMTEERIHELTRIDRFFLAKFINIVRFEQALANAVAARTLDVNMLRRAKRMGFTDRRIAEVTGIDETAIEAQRKEAA